MSTLPDRPTTPEPSQGRPSLPGESTASSGAGPAAVPTRREPKYRKKPRTGTSLGMTGKEVADLLGINPSDFSRLHRERADFPKPLLPFWPGGRRLYDRDLILKWWKKQARDAQQEQEGEGSR